MRQIHRKDSTQDEIVEALRKVGVAVASLNSVGGGIPDLLCSIRSYTCLVECKAPGGKLRKEQVTFMEKWPGDIWIAESAAQAVDKVLAGARHVFERSA